MKKRKASRRFASAPRVRPLDIPVPDPASLKPLFPFGAVHQATYLKQSPPLDGPDFKAWLRKDLEAMRGNGFNAFTLMCDWRSTQVTEKKWDFSATDSAFELCRELGFRILLMIWPELTPFWFLRKYPQEAMVSANGFKSLSHSIGSSRARKASRRFMHEVLRRYASDPLVMGYDVNMEGALWWTHHADNPNYDSQLWDYNPESIRRYRAWLAARYRDISALNRLYRSHWKRFDEIDPPRIRPFQDVSLTGNQMNWMDWRLFVCDLYADHTLFKVNCVRELDRVRPIGDHTHGNDPALWGQNVWLYGHAVEAMGVSMFTSDNGGDFMDANYLVSRQRSAAKGKPLWVWELRAGPTAWGLNNWSSPPTGADIARFTWQLLGQGAQLIQYWNWRAHQGGVEVGGHGLTRRDGSLTDRAVRAGEISDALNRQAGFVLGLTPEKASIAILDSPRSRILASGEGADQLIVGAERHTYAALRSRGFTVDFVSEEEVLSGVLSRYRLLCLPLAYAVSERAARAVEAWVKAGGFLFSGPFCAGRDENGFSRDQVPGAGLDAVFGCRDAWVDDMFEFGEGISLQGGAWDVKTTARPEARLGEALRPGGLLQPGDLVAGFKYRIILETLGGGRAVASWKSGEPALVRGSFGQGQTLYLGTFPHRDSDFGDDGLSRLLEDFASLAGAQPAVTIEDRGSSRLQSHWLEGKREALLVLLNAETEPRELRVRLNTGQFSTAVDFISGEPVGLEGNRLRVRVEARDARVLRLGENG